MRNVIYEENLFRSEVMVRKYINDEIQRSISYIKNKVQIYIEKKY